MNRQVTQVTHTNTDRIKVCLIEYRRTIYPRVLRVYLYIVSFEAFCQKKLKISSGSNTKLESE